MTTNTTSPEPGGEVRKYLRLVLLSSDSAMLYKKDFEPRIVFEEFVRSLVIDLVPSGVVENGDLYSAVIIPRYEEMDTPSLRLEHDSAKVNESRPWISLEFEEGLDPERPVSYFTVEIRVRTKHRIYRNDFHLYKLNHFFRRIESALRRMGVLHPGDRYIVQIFAREDGKAELERDEVYALKDEASSLVELSPDEEQKPPEFARKSLDDYEAEESVGEKGAGGSIEIVVTRPALTTLQAVARRRAKVEVGGVLVGNVYSGTGPSSYLVEISDHIFAEGALSSEVELRYTFESWQKRSTELKERFPDRRIVGWYHTHLVKAAVIDEAGQTVQETEHFFSVSDHFMHRQFFPDKWYVAMVLNPQGEAAFFRWRGNDIVREPVFHVVRG
jgi:proteasome lid subunit RPN8/RPN11